MGPVSNVSTLPFVFVRGALILLIIRLGEGAALLGNRLMEEEEAVAAVHLLTGGRGEEAEEEVLHHFEMA